MNILDDHDFINMRDEMHKESNKIPLDNEMIVFEGCEEDDKIVLGGRKPFLLHFCTFFNFNICQAQGEFQGVQKGIKRFNDANQLDKELNAFMDKFDDKK